MARIWYGYVHNSAANKGKRMSFIISQIVSSCLTLLIFGSALFLTGGCAKMDASQCRNADWEIIGFEDGSAGRLPSYLSNYRKACAKYDIIPELDFYLRGHANGLIEFCTETNGFLSGKKGLEYNGVCPRGLSDNFLAGYQIGLRFYIVSSAIDKMEFCLRNEQKKLKELRKELRHKEEMLIQDSTSESDRRRLLNETKDARLKIERLEKKIFHTRKDIQMKQYEYEQLSIQYGSQG
ncbi:DUF2799 domain-containing protein [Desulfotignum phosphitoxidans]|nr:DUF2799 domain-containing protein [Desulfotignum phosphitoxidans]